MTLERNPNSKNMFYVDPELFPIEGENYTIKIDEPTGKFSIFPFDSNDINITAHVDGGIGGKSFFVYVERAIFNSMNYMRFRATDDNWLRTFDDTNVLGYPVLSGDSFAYWSVDVGSSVDSERVTLTFSFYDNTNLIMAGPQGIALALDSDPISEWQSAYREAKIDIDPALSSKLITVGQLSRLKGSGTASGAQADKLVTMGQLARLTGKQAPAEDKKNKLVTVGQAYSVV